VLDTNVLVAGLRSRRGASFRLLELVVAGAVRPVLSVPLVLEYEAVLKHQGSIDGLLAPGRGGEARRAIAHGISCAVRWGPPTEDCHREMDFESLRGYAPFDELLRSKG
jgi:hypothetical protein